MPKQQDAAKPAGFSRPWPRQSLLDDAATKISINQSPLGTFNSIYQHGIVNPVPCSKPNERPCLEHPHQQISPS